VTAASRDPLGELLGQSLLAWRIQGTLERRSDGALRIHAPPRAISVERAPAEVPFRWIVEVDGRRRGALSIAAVLRQVRAALDPCYLAKGIRVAVAPPVSS
jgi:hypothetical protein